MGRVRKAASKAALLEADHKIQEERQRIAEHIVRELRKAGYDCTLGDSSFVPPLRCDN